MGPWSELHSIVDPVVVALLMPSFLLIPVVVALPMDPIWEVLLVTVFFVDAINELLVERNQNNVSNNSNQGCCWC